MTVKNDVCNRGRTGSSSVVLKRKESAGVDWKECISSCRDTPLVSPGGDRSSARSRASSAGMCPGRGFLYSIAKSHSDGHPVHYFSARSDVKDVPRGS